MELVKVHFVTHKVAKLASFYADLTGASVTLNDYYVEVPTPCGTISISKPRTVGTPDASQFDPSEMTVILEFLVDDVDADYERIKNLGVRWLSPPTTQPGGNRSMAFRDPCGNLITVFSRDTERGSIE